MLSVLSPCRGVLFLLILLAASCARQPASDGFTDQDFPPLEDGEKNLALGQIADPDASLQLQISAQPLYLPGQAVIFDVELTNLDLGTKRLLSLDHRSLVFYMFPATEEGRRSVRKIEPVYSESEPTGLMTPLAAGQSLKRRFLFTQLTFERGQFVLMAECTQPGKSITDLPLEGKSKKKRSKKNTPGDSTPQKIYSAPFTYSVAGDKVAAHRYLNGLLSRKDALALASGEVKGEVIETESIRILDEMGFEKYWVNVRYRDASGQDAVRSFFIDPHLARVWKEAQRPFNSKATSGGKPFPNDSKIYKDIRAEKYGQIVQ
jgi:hypothetical protein